MALTPEQIEGIRETAGQIAEPVVSWLLQDITERVSLAGKMTGTAAYEIYRAEALGQARRALKKYLKRQLGLSNRQLRQLFRQAARLAGEDDYRRAGQAFDFAESDIARMAEAAAALAQKDFTNLTQTLGMTAPDSKAYPLQETYRRAMDHAFERVFTGAQDYQSAIREATAQLAARGVTVIDYESGVHTSLEAATRRNVMGGMGLLVEQIEQRNHDELGCNGWEISAHHNSAPDHEPYQGRQYSDAAFLALNGTAERPGRLKRRIGTLNCGHIASPIILGVDSPQYSEAELAEMRRKNAEGITYEGRHYTGYEATQMQRRLERAIRVQKRRVKVAETAGDKQALLTARVRQRVLNQRYAEFSAAAGLRTQQQRLEIAGFKSSSTGPVLMEATAGASDITVQGQTLYSVTDEAVEAVPKPFFRALTGNGNAQAQEYARGVLRAVQGLPEGTEATISFTLDGKTFRRAAGTSGEMRVRVQDLAAPYISLHNHASNGILSPEDVFTLLSHDRMRGIGAVGNKGALFTCEKVFGYSQERAKSWYRLLRKQYPKYQESSNAGIAQRIAFAQALRKGGEKYGLHFVG